MYMLSVPGTSTSQAEGMRLFAHHAHDGARHHAEELFHRSPALHRADGHVGLLHPAVDDCAELRHLHQRIIRNACGRDILLDGRELGLRGIVVVLHAIDAAEDFRQIDRLDRDAAGFEDALGIANRVERRGTRADRADAEILQALHDAADRREPLQVGLELRRRHGSPCAAWSAST